MADRPPTIAVTSTLAMVRTAAARGLETADILRAAGVAREALEDPDVRLPAPSVLAIWNALRERAADPALQLAAPATLPWGAYRVIDYLVAASPTVGTGIERFARFFGLIAEGVSLRVEASGDERHLCLTRADGGAVPPVYVDYVLAALVGRVRMRIKPDLRVARVELRQPAPPATSPYQELFRAPVHFGADGDRLSFGGAEWDAPTVTGDAALAGLLEEHARILAHRIPRAPTGFQADVQKAIASGLPERGSVEHVARALHVSVRTLQRKLVAAGTTFKEVADAVRSRLAEEYLTDPTVSIAEVAFLLGFSDQSSFNRAFGRWTGVPPGKWRRGRHGLSPSPGRDLAARA
jgi:AraC-like DNA-binding protein